MIVAPQFETDPMHIADIQHDAYSEALWRIYSFALNLYQEAENLLEVKTPLGLEARERTKFDHRTQQWLHDCIAGGFRWQYDNSLDLYNREARLHQSEQEIEGDWFKYLRDELKDISTYHPNFPRYVLVATNYPNPDPRGIVAEDWLSDLACERYPFLESCQHYRKKRDDG